MKINDHYLIGQGIHTSEFTALNIAAEDLLRNINGKSEVYLKRETVSNMNKKGIYIL